MGIPRRERKEKERGGVRTTERIGMKQSELGKVRS